MQTIPLDEDGCYRAVQARDPRFDGWFVVAVRTTGIYCRPSCPATTPRRRNVSFLPTAAAAQRGGFRACKRCRPDATPGSPAWNGRADLVARAMRLIADGIVDREGVAGVARRVHCSTRHLDRQLVAEVGAGPLALARAQRAQTARTLIETTAMSMTDVAFAAGFSSVRQFNDTVRTVFADTPTRLRSGRDVQSPPAGSLSLRLPYRGPFHSRHLLHFLAAHAVAGVERVDGATFSRALDLPHGPAVVELSLDGAASHVRCTFRLADWRDLPAGVSRCRRLLDLDADPEAIDDALGQSAVLGPLVASAPGLRSPAFADGAEGVVRSIVGQQVSVSGAATVLGRLVAAHGEALPESMTAPAGAGVTVTFPRASTLAGVDPATLPMPRARARSLVNVCSDLASGALVVDVAADPRELRQCLLQRPGIGPWTADYVTMRSLGHPDVFLPTDLGARRALSRLGQDGDPFAVARLAGGWSPWRSYALHHLWATLADDVPVPSIEESS